MKRFLILSMVGVVFLAVCYVGITGTVIGIGILGGREILQSHDYGHNVKDLPVYPDTQHVEYSIDGPTKCSILKFVTDHLPEDVQAYYLNALGGPDKGWYGDGSHYPEFNPVTTHHEDHGPRLTAYLKFSANSNQTDVEVKICREE